MVFIINAISLFFFQFVIGILWYSVFFNKLFLKVAEIKIENISKEAASKAYKKQFFLVLLRSLTISFMVLLFPPLNPSLVLILILIIFMLPTGLFESNIWTQKHTNGLMWLNIFFTITNFLLMFIIAFSIRSIFN